MVTSLSKDTSLVNFHEDPISSFHVKLLTDTNNKRLLGRGKHKTKRAKGCLEAVGPFDLSTHRVQLVLVDLLNLSQSLSHLVLPELAILSRRVAVRQRRKLFHLLRRTNTRDHTPTHT